MTYFKIIRNGVVIDAGHVFLKWNLKRHRMYISEAIDAQFVQNYKLDKIYRSYWLKPAPQEAGEYELVNIVIISEQEYYDVVAQLDDGEEIVIPDDPIPEPTPDIPDPDEKPMTLEEMRRMIKQQAEQILFLEDCLLEMSEIVYE